MEPVFREFDRVITFNWGKIQKGSVVVFKGDSNHLIKRVSKLNGEKVTTVSDNKSLAKKVYELKRSDVVGRVFLKY